LHGNLHENRQRTPALPAAGLYRSIAGRAKPQQWDAMRKQVRPGAPVDAGRAGRRVPRSRRVLDRAGPMRYHVPRGDGKSK
jgi:hypothetical protein